MPRRRSCGFTLVELLTALSITALLAAVALPAWHSQRERAARQEAIALMTRLQAEQERFRAHHGRYAMQVTQLGVTGARTAVPHGGYRIDLDATRSQRYTLRADRVEPAAEHECSTLTLTVDEGFAALGPNARCWNR